MSASHPTVPLRTRVHRGLQRHAVASPLTLPFERTRVAAELARRASS